MTDESRQRDRIFLELFLKKAPEQVTEKELAYFREHPEQIDEVTAPVNVHKLFLWTGALIGAALVALSKALKYGQVLVLSEGLRELVVDIVFESGVALIGAAITAYILGILLNKQQDSAARWRAEIRRKLEETT